MGSLKYTFFLIPCLLLAPAIEAGTGPETTLLVVNADSPLSLTVANHWMELRRIPNNHVVWLHEIPMLDILSMNDFRSRILKPIVRYMQQEGLVDDIDVIVYSADFPYAVALKKELRRNKMKGHRYIGQSASLTGLTFFTNQVIAGKVDYLTPTANHYFRREIGKYPVPFTPMSKEEKARQEKAIRALKKGRAEEASGLLKGLTERHPNMAYLRLLWAEALVKLGQLQAALDQLKELPRLGYDNTLALRNNRLLKPLRQSPAFKKILGKIEKSNARFEPAHGFHSRYHWNRAYLPGMGGQDRYYLSAALAYTGPRGNSLPEIERYLLRSRQSDSTHPKGTVYLMENGNIRTETRQPWYGETCTLLHSIGHACEVLTSGKNGENGILPRKRLDIIGLTTGTKTFHWKKSGSRLLKGAFADSLTSYAGHFENPKQTKLTEFLRQGAAGSSGAVSEPYSIAAKFPLPLIHYYYALGYSLVESWYQSVASPYHAILVGDPLAQPFSDPIVFTLQTPEPRKTWTGKVNLEMGFDEGIRVDHFEAWVDGKRITRSAAGEVAIWDTTEVADGYHELRLVAVEPSPREGRTMQIHAIRVNNNNLAMSLQSDQLMVNYGTPFLLHGTAPLNSSIVVRQGNRELVSTSSTNGSWKAALSTASMGMGSITIQAIATTPEGMQVFSNPLHLHIGEPETLKRQGSSEGPWKQGFDALMVFTTNDYPERREKKKLDYLNGKQDKIIEQDAKLEDVTLSGEFLVRRKGFYQFSVKTRGNIEITVDSRTFTGSAPSPQYGMIFIPLFLEKGWHSLKIHPDPSGFRKLKIVLSGQEPPAILGGKRVRSLRND